MGTWHSLDSPGRRAIENYLKTTPSTVPNLGDSHTIIKEVKVRAKIARVIGRDLAVPKLTTHGHMRVEMNEKANGKQKLFSERSARERAAFKTFVEHKVANPAPRLKVSENGGQTSITLDDPKSGIGDLLLMEALGSMDPDFVDGLLRQLGDAGAQDGKVNEKTLNFMLAVVKGVKPKDQVEAMLAAQMAAVHIAAMRFAGDLTRVETMLEQDSAERALNKLTRTFTTQTEALKRYRTGGEEKVTLRDVAIAEGAQESVGNVAHASPDDPEKTAASQQALANARIIPMPRSEKGKERVSVRSVRRSGQ